MVEHRIERKTIRYCVGFYHVMIDMVRRKASSRFLILTAVIVLVIALVSAFIYFRARKEVSTPEIASLTLSSEAFDDGGNIPVKYTCDGEDISPPLSWGDPPEGTVSFVLIVEDPDAPMGVFTHWVIYNIPASLRGLPEGVPAQGEVEGTGVQGKNDFNRLGYGGPCPPKGPAHRYVFKLYALDTSLNLKAGATKKQVLKEMEGHILGYGELTGKYGRG